MAFDLASEVYPARTQLIGQTSIVLVADDVLRVMLSSLTDPLLRAKVTTGKTWKLTISIFGTEEDA